MKTFQIRTLGCKVNQYESQVLLEKFLSAGFKEARGDKADIYIVNTCAVTQKAEKESRGFIHGAHNQNSAARIFATGCLAHSSPQELSAMKEVTCVVRNNQKNNLLNLILPLKPEGRPKNGSGKVSGISTFSGHARAFVKIQDGCNNSCSYCIVPQVRGRCRSRPLGLIKDEAQRLAKNGYKEIVLCGICLGSYGTDLVSSLNLVKVIEALEDIEGLLRIRLSSIEASDINNELVEKLRKPGKLCRHLHIPFQSGDDKILKLMNRRLSALDYLKLASRLREFCPGLAITTDIIAGFPQEDDECFSNTVKFLKEIRPSRIHVFSFSPRKNTPAYSLSGRIPWDIVRKRVNLLKTLGNELSVNFYETQLGKELSVLIESTPDPQTGLYKGYSDNYIKIFVPKRMGIRNTVVKVKAVKACRDGISGLISR